MVSIIENFIIINLVAIFWLLLGGFLYIKYLKTPVDLFIGRNNQLVLSLDRKIDTIKSSLDDTTDTIKSSLNGTINTIKSLKDDSEEQILDINTPIQQGFNILNESVISYLNENLSPEGLKPIIKEAMDQSLPEFADFFSKEISKILGGSKGGVPPSMDEQALAVQQQGEPDFGKMIQMMIMQYMASKMGNFMGGGGQTGGGGSSSDF